ncbi:hypothetical protein CKF54_07220 [Psittacicella hinzii]|uniref:DUF805 domain-containing protein n=1 Tax=Psittacicella hinzii TaxID=2028575 RepID=A0A3A1Y1N6_9GAMM|nr:DUF805 domain-containing protein [Psittacicella hinzii]RIY31209.1 hypothetical protein CKF54_07220 [Psittacicella hinzii]
MARASFNDIVIKHIQNMFNYKAYEKRREFNLFFLFMFIVTLCLALLAATIPGFELILNAINIFFLLVFLAATARRLRDAGLHPAFTILAIVPIANFVLLIMCMAMQTKELNNPHRTFPIFPDY